MDASDAPARPVTRRPLVIAAAILVVGLGVGVAVGAGLFAVLNSSPASSSADSAPGAHMGMGNHSMIGVTDEFDYLVEMIPHHEEAIDRAGDLLARSPRPEMRDFAQSIIDVQSAEVEQMRTWLAVRFPERPNEPAYVPMMRSLEDLSGDELDRTFLEDMIPHHMIAVMMSESFVVGGKATHADVVPFAQTIRDTQLAEVSMMETWLPAWFGPDASYRHGSGMGGMHAGQNGMHANG